MRPHYSQSSREKATASSGTSPLASYKEVSPPHPPGMETFFLVEELWELQQLCQKIKAL